MKRFLKSLMLLLCSGLFAMTGWAETITVNQETIGINFSRKDATLSTTSDVLYGYQSGTQGGLLAERAWQSFYAPNDSDPYGNPFVTNQAYPITTAGNPSLNITLTKKSDNNVWGPNANKLFGSYLDNGSTLEFYGLPASGYDVAIIFAGDGGKFSRVTVNGTNKTYNANGELVNGTSSWGDRTQSANDLKQLTATGTATAGQVMYLANLNAETLKLQTVSDQNNINVGRGTIAAIQIYLKPGLFKKPSPVWTWDGAGGTDSGEKINDIPVYTISGKVINADNAIPGGIPAKNFTFSMWTKKTSNPNWKDVCGFSDTTHQFKLEENANGGLYVYGTAHGLNTDATPKFISAADYTTDRLQLLTVVQENGIVKGYINGELKMTTLESTAWTNLKSDDATMKYFAWGCSPTTGGGADRPLSISAADVRIYNVALSDAQVEALYNSYYPLSMAAATDESGALSWSEITAVVGNRTTWNVSGDVKISLDADIDPALTALTLNPVNVSGDKLTITGTGSLYGDGSTFALTTEIPVDITNQKNNPTITLSGAGDVTIRKGKGGIAPAMNNYTGTFTVDDGQQITRMSGNLTIPFTVGANGAKLHSNGSDWTVTSEISGSGTLTIESPSHTISFTSDTTEFSGNVEILSGTLYLDKGKGSVGNVFNNANTTLTVKSGAIFKTHLTQNDTSNYSRGLILEPGAQVINHDGHMNYNGDLVVNNGGDANSTSTYQLVYNKTADFKGVISGQGTLNLTVGDTQYSPHTVKISNENNTFSGTYHINPNNGNYTQLILEANGKMDDASVKMSKGQFKLMRDNTSIVSLSGTEGTVTSNNSTERTLTLSGDSDVRNLTFTSVNLVIAAGETFITPITKATVAADAKVKVVLTADQKLNGLELANVTVNDGGMVVFLDADGTTVLQSANSNAYAGAQECTYTVAEEGGAWNKEPENNDAITLDFGEITGRTLDTTILPDGVTRLAKITITGSNAMVAASLLACADTIESATAWSLVGGAEEFVEVSSVISGAGQVKIASGKVTFPNAKTYTGGTDIAEGATLTIGNVNAIGTTGTITGAGTLVCNGVLPTTAEQRITNANWRGKVVLQAIPSFTDLDLDEFGNADSVIELNGIGNGTNRTYMRHTQTIDSDVILTGDNWFTDGSYLTTVTFNGDISGDGAFKFKKYNGSSNPAETWIFNGAYNASIVNEDATARKIIFGSGTAEGGKIVIAKDVTIAAQKTWSAVNGIAIMGGATLTVNGAITGAIANAGILIYGVDTTASNTISGAGAIQVAAAKTVDLSAATLTNFAGTYVVGEGATLKLPLAATAEKSIALGTDAKLLVVLNDEQKGAEQSVTVTGGSVQFVDANGNVLCNGASYSMPIYIVGEGWIGANRFAGANIVIDFAETTGGTVDLASILGDVTALTKLTVVGKNGGTLTKTESEATVTATSTAINTNTTIDAGVASLGAVTIAEGKTLTVKDTATVSTLSGTGVYNLDLGETPVNNYTFAADGKNYKVSSGTFTNVTLERSATKTTYEFAGGTITMATAQAGADHGNVDVGQFSFGTADVTISGGKINATHLVTVQEGNNRSTTINQTGGDIILSGTGDGSDTRMNQQTIMFGHWRNAESTYTLSGGSLVAENGGMRISNDSPATVSISGGLLKVKGIKGKGEQTTSLTLSGGKLSIGDWGMAAIGNLTFTAQGGEINAFGNATINQAIALNGNVTLSADAGKTLTIKASVTGTGTETLTLAGKIIFAVRPTNIGKLVFEEGAVLCFTENISDDGEITLPTIEGTPTIKIIRADGETEVNASIVDGKATFTPLYSGKICWHDYEFNKNLNDAGYGKKNLTRDSGRPSWSEGGQNTTNESEIATDYKDFGDGNYALFAATHPYTDFTYPEEWTAVIVATLPEEENEILLAFGTVDGGTISLIKGKNADEVKLVRTTGNSKYEALATMTVPNATTAAHLYAFTKTARQIKIYLDGSLWLTYDAQSDITFGAGFQIASVFGGLGSTGMKRPEEEEEGVSYIDALRMYEAVLSQKAITALANEFPYNSPKGTYMRTVNGEVNWVEEGEWTKVGDNENTYASPAPGSTVILTAEDDATVVVNLDGNVPYEAITVNGDATVRFNKGTGKTGVIQNSGKTQIDTNVTITAGVMEVHGGPLTVSANNSLTFDYSQHDFSTYYVDSEILLTGIATVSDDTAVAISLGSATLPSHIESVICEPNATKNYVLAITVTGTLSATIENSEITWKVGNVEIGTPADFTAWETIPMTVVGANTLTLADITMPSVTLTRSGEGAAAVTFDSGKLTVTNTLTMNNVNVMATPDTLAAAVVMGTAGTESFTMHSRASYSHDNAFAMRFENCAFTKDGEGTFPIASSGFVLDRVKVTLANGALQLVIGSGDPQIKDTTFTYEDANKDGVADGELTNHGWVHSTTTTTFKVPEGVTGKALVGSCLSNTGAVVKQGAGTLVLGVMKTDNAGPYTGATTIEAGTLVYDVTNKTADTFVMQSAITVKTGAAIKGSANCTLASLSLANGAIIDATDSAVTATTVTLPTGEGAKVVLKKNASGDVLTYTGETPNMALFSVPEGKVLGAKIEGNTVTLVLTQVSVPEVVIPPDATDEERAELEKQQTEAKVAAQEVADALAASTDEGTRTANVTAIENPGVASVIENAGVDLIPNEGEETYTAKFTYNFGVSALDVVALNLDDVEGTELYVVVKAELDDDYSFANGVTVTVTDGDENVPAAKSVTSMDGTTTTEAPTGNTRYFRFPLPTNLGTHSYKVRASK